MVFFFYYNNKSEILSIDCIEGCDKCSDDSTCETCSAGYKIDDDDQCIICPAGTYAEAGSDTCTPCDDDEYSEEGSGSCSSNSVYFFPHINFLS